MDIKLDAPLPAGFFQNKPNGEEFWVQFKYERLSDFCYSCGALDHVTGRCSLGKPAMSTTENGIVAKLYGPSIRAEHSETLLFINPEPESNQRVPYLVSRGEEDTEEKGGIFERFDGYLSDSDKTLQSAGNTQSEDLQLVQNEIHKSIELETLALTLKKQEWGEGRMQETVIQRIRSENFDSFDLARWAAAFVKEIAVHNAGERREVGRVDPKFLMQMDLGLAEVGIASSQNSPEMANITGLKRAAQCILEKPRNQKLCIAESPISNSKNRVNSGKTEALLNKLERLEVSTPKPRRSARFAVPFDPNGEFQSKPGKEKGGNRGETAASGHGKKLQGLCRLVETEETRSKGKLLVANRIFTWPGRRAKSCPPPHSQVKIMSWNCRGMGSQESVRYLKDKVRKFAPDVVFLVETKANKKKDGSN